MKLIVYRIKIPYPLQWGAPTFDAGHAFGMMAAVLVSLIEVIHHIDKTRESVNQGDIFINEGKKSKAIVFAFYSQLELTRLHHV